MESFLGSSIISWSHMILGCSNDLSTFSSSITQSRAFIPGPHFFLLSVFLFIYLIAYLFPVKESVQRRTVAKLPFPRVISTEYWLIIFLPSSLNFLRLVVDTTVLSLLRGGFLILMSFRWTIYVSSLLYTFTLVESSPVFTFDFWKLKARRDRP